jgi:heme iron utilization protein
MATARLAGICASPDRPFFGRRSCSLQFINIEGGAMFKVFVGRDEKRELFAGQLARFERLRNAEAQT